MANEQIQYLAGLVDGEGGLWGGFTGPHKNSWRVQVSANNTNREVLETIKTWTMTGHIYERRNIKGHFGTKPMFIWQNTVTETSVLLIELMYPYLRVKRSKAKQILPHLREDAIDPMSWPYVAAFFDGEGSASFVGKTEAKGTHEHYDLTIVQKADRPILEEIQQFLGYGALYAHGEGSRRLEVKDHENQLRFAKGVLPYSIIKKDKIQAMTQFIESKEWNYDKKLRHLDKSVLKTKYESGASVRDLAKEYGVRYSTMYFTLKRLGTQLRPLGTNWTFKNPSPLANLTKQELAAKYNSGMSAYEIGREYGVSHGAIQKWLKKFGIVTRPNAKLRGITRLELLTKWREVGTTKTAKIYGVTRKSVYVHLKAIGAYEGVN